MRSLRLARRPVRSQAGLLGCIAAFGAASLLTAFVTDATQLTLARLATGVGLGGGIPVCIALVSDVSPPHRQGTLVITMITGVVVGNLAAGLAAARMLSSFGWESVFIVGGVAPLVLLPLVAMFLRESSAVPGDPLGRGAGRNVDCINRQPRGGAVRPRPCRPDDAALGD